MEEHYAVEYTLHSTVFLISFFPPISLTHSLSFLLPLLTSLTCTHLFTHYHPPPPLSLSLSLSNPQNRREKSVLTLVVLFLAGNIYFVYYVFREQQLYNWLVEHSVISSP